MQEERRAERATKRLRGGLLIVLTGPGKGKSSSAFGMVARALGWDMRVGIVQFIKGKWQTGEKQFFRRFPDQVTFEVMGEGFTWDVQDRQRDIAAAHASMAAQLRDDLDPQFDFVLLDELNIALRSEYLDVAKVVAFLKQRPRDKHICITGRDANCALAGNRRPRHRGELVEASVPGRLQGAAGNRVLTTPASCCVCALRCCRSSPQARAEAPARIVSLNQCLDAILVELVPTEHIAAISHYSRDPLRSTHRALAQRLPITYETAEEIVALRPDLVLASRHSAIPTRNALRRVGIHFELFDVAFSVRGESRADPADRGTGRQRRGR